MLTSSNRYFLLAFGNDERLENVSFSDDFLIFYRRKALIDLLFHVVDKTVNDIVFFDSDVLWPGQLSDAGVDFSVEGVDDGFKWFCEFDIVLCHSANTIMYQIKSTLFRAVRIQHIQNSFNRSIHVSYNNYQVDVIIKFVSSWLHRCNWELFFKWDDSQGNQHKHLNRNNSQCFYRKYMKSNEPPLSTSKEIDRVICTTNRNSC